VDCWSLLDIPGEGGGEAAALWLEHGWTVPVHAATFDNEASRRLVLDYKHGRRIALARLLARLIAARFSGSAHDGAAPLLVPPLLHRWLLWQRGFNQAALLAGELARLGKGETVVDGLIRRKRTPRLGELGREACERGLAGRVRVLAPGARW
jgi:predicted amidophosphoribosyltransferase